MTEQHYDVVIVGAGLAGLCLARQLLLYSSNTLLLVDRRVEIPPRRQKVGESTVQLSGYYLSKVLDLEEHLLREHFLKYNLRFYWKSNGRENRDFEDFSQSYIRTYSNIAGYQLDRNKLEAELLRLNREHSNFTFCAPANDLNISLSDEGPHAIAFRNNGSEVRATAGWVVDTTGRSRFFTKRMELARENPIRHGSSFCWVEGLVNVEKLTDLPLRQVRLKKERAYFGHAPLWLATNHFVGEGFWFWMIPLQGKTSLGLVYDKSVISHDEVGTPQELIAWICREFPLLQRDLPYRKILDQGCFRDFSYDCAQTISASRWALSGEAGRFSDPLYSPGGDLISLYNTLIADAILSDADELRLKVRLYETLMRVFYEAYVPSYAVSYDVLGDQEAFALKYGWELAVYFSFYVLPFINDLFSDSRFILPYLGRFSRLGPVNRCLQSFISAYYQWKKAERQPRQRPTFFDFYEMPPLRAAETLFYRVGLSAEEVLEILDSQLATLMEFARYIAAYIASRVLSDEGALMNRPFVEGLDLESLSFDPGELRARYEAVARSPERYPWSFDPYVLRKFEAEPQAELEKAGVGPGGAHGRSCAAD